MNTQQIVVFTLDRAEYGVPILQVKEVVHMAAVAPVPNSPAYIVGVMNLRGTIVTVLDLEQLFELQRQSPANSNHILIATTTDGTVYGIQVDQVTEVLRLPDEVIKPAPTLGNTKISADYLRGVAVLPSEKSDRMILLLDILQIIDGKVVAAANTSLIHTNTPGKEAAHV